jgi:hypothetical protein
MSQSEYIPTCENQLAYQIAKEKSTVEFPLAFFDLVGRFEITIEN